MNRRIFSLARLVLFAILAGCTAGLGACASSKSGTITQLSFDSPEDALAALRYAAATGDREYSRSLFGPEVDEFSSGDPAVDAYERTLFIAAINRRNELRANDDGSVDILVGERAVPFPAPVVRYGDRWLFDTPEGVERLTDIRVGYHELRTIAALRAIHLAQEEFRNTDPDRDGHRRYASRILSSEGKRDGLYWDPKPDEPASPLGFFYVQGEVPLSQTLGYNGYFFLVLPKQGTENDLESGYLVIAYPAVYDRTGVMTFAMGADGVIYEKDLGFAGTPRAGQTVRAAGTGHEGWEPVQK